MRPHFCLPPTLPLPLNAMLVLVLASTAHAHTPEHPITAPLEADSVLTEEVRNAATDLPATQPWEPLPVRRQIEVGSATESLLANQRVSRSIHPRTIDGTHASRSYQRYLKSFETAIPERFSTGMDLAK